MNLDNVKYEDFVGIFENIAPQEFCTNVIELFDEIEKVGLTFNRQKQDPSLPTTFKNDDSLNWAHLDILRHDHASPLYGDFRFILERCYGAYAEKYSALRDVEQHRDWGNKIQKTQVGGGYHIWHCEHASAESSRRVLAYILYLNDVDEGGETEFLYTHKRYKPKAGTMIIFPSSFTHTHRGNPPLSNSKYIITGWLEY